MLKKNFFLLFFLLFLGACASKMKDQMKAYREAYSSGKLDEASKLLKKSVLKKDKKSVLLWHLENGTVALNLGKNDEAISHFQAAIDLIDLLYTTKLSSKAASFLINDASDEFYGSSYERSYAYYFLAKSYYAKFQVSKNPQDLQGARGTILAWDSYFSQLQRSATYKTLYHTDLMLKVFGGEIHEVSEIRNDKQISLQLYKDALQILENEGGTFSVFNSKSVDFIKGYEESIKAQKPAPTKSYEKTLAYDDLKDFLQYKILAITKDIRGFDFQTQVKALKPDASILKRVEKPANTVFVIEEGLIPAKVGKVFNFGLKGAMDAVENPTAKKFIATVGTEVVTVFAMNKLGMFPAQTSNPGSFIFAHDMTRLAVQEAAIEFELPMIETVPPTQRMAIYVLNEKGVVVSKSLLPIISDNGDISRLVLEEDVVARYVKTGTRVAIRHIVAIVAAMQVYNRLKGGDNGADFIAKAAAMATYVGASKGISALEKADTRFWRTLPQSLRMTELHLAPGNYSIGLALLSGKIMPEAPSKILGNITVEKSGKAIHHLRFMP
jgi:hypothetical protein